MTMREFQYRYPVWTMVNWPCVQPGDGSIAMVQLGTLCHDVALTFGVNKSTITRLMTRYRDTGDVKDRAKNGCPRKNPQKLTTESREWLPSAVMSQRMVSELMSRIPVSQTIPS